MKLSICKFASVLTLSAVAVFANASSSDNTDLIFNDDTLFNNSVTTQISEHRQINSDTLTKLVMAPTRSSLKSSLGVSKNISYKEDGETWFYGLEVQKNANEKEKCLIAFVFDAENKKKSTVADIVSFDKKSCESALVLND